MNITLDRNKLYSSLEAVKLARQTATNKFDGKIEAHFVLKSIGKFGKWRTERKIPLLHAVLGKQSETPESLAVTLQEMIKTISTGQILKLTVCATMGPGVKVQIENVK